MKCGEFLERFERYCQGEMTEAERREFEKEVEVCKYLRGFKADYETCLELIRCSCQERDDDAEAKLPEMFVETLVAQVTTVRITTDGPDPNGPKHA